MCGRVQLFSLASHAGHARTELIRQLNDVVWHTLRLCSLKTRLFVIDTAVSQLKALAAAAREPGSGDEKREWELLEEKTGSDDENGEGAEGFEYGAPDESLATAVPVPAPASSSGSVYAKNDASGPASAAFACWILDLFLQNAEASEVCVCARARGTCATHARAGRGGPRARAGPV